jgi:hypothetical protein
VSFLPLQGDGGHTFLCVWNETPVWDRLTAAPLPVTPVKALVGLSRPARAVLWDLMSDKPAMEVGSSARIAFALAAHPVLLQIG